MSIHAPEAGMGAGTAAWSTSQLLQKWLPAKAAPHSAWAPVRPPRLPPMAAGVKPRNRTAVPPRQQASGRMFWQRPSPVATKLVAVPPSVVNTCPLNRLPPVDRMLADDDVQPPHVL